MTKLFCAAVGASVLFLTCPWAVRTDPPRGDGLVRTAGTHELHGGKLMVRVTERGDKLTWSVQRVADPAAGIAGKTVS